jgi:hypothetical protein
VKKIVFLLGKEIEHAAGDDRMEGRNEGESDICSVGKAEEMKRLIVCTVLIQEPVVGDKIGIIDFFFQNGSDV